ncbi:lytic murein transglycosylase [soil metagenome]
MKRRAFLASTVCLAIAPATAWPPFAQVAGETGPRPTVGVPETDPRFEAWLPGFRQRAIVAGWPEAFLDRELAGLTADPRVLALDSRQPEFTKPTGAYVQATASASRIALGMQKRAAVSTFLDPAAQKYGVPAEILVAIWGVETAFGSNLGDYDVVRSYATLAAEGHRPAWAEAQLFQTLKIIQSGEVSRAKLRGSWAGAMGQTQFTPEDFLNWGVDGDGDGVRDIWGSSADALTSAANFLSRKAAWRRGGSWAREVQIPTRGFDFSLVEGASHTPAEWRALGVVTADGGALRPADLDSAATLIMPQGWRGPAFLIFPNHMAIRAYNNSTAYALGVGILADGIGGAAPLIKAWPDDPPLGLADRMAAQTALLRLGFDPGAAGGVFGTATRKAARGWQASRGLPADGYLPLSAIQMLKLEAGLGTADSAVQVPQA